MLATRLAHRAATFLPVYHRGIRYGRMVVSTNCLVGFVKVSHVCSSCYSNSEASIKHNRVERNADTEPRSTCVTGSRTDLGVTSALELREGISRKDGRSSGAAAIGYRSCQDRMHRYVVLHSLPPIRPW